MSIVGINFQLLTIYCLFNKGTIERITPHFAASVALSNTKVVAAVVRIDGDHEDNQNLKTNFDEGEFVETLFVPVKDLPKTLQEFKERDDYAIDIALGLFAEGTNLSLE